MLAGALLSAAVTLSVPFVPQQEDTCGAAALAMVLQYHGREVAQESIAAELLEPELGGIRGSRLAEFARSRGMVAIAFVGDPALLREHVSKGRPLIVALSAGGGRNHDVVVVGVDGERREWILNDPAEGAERRIDERELERRWKDTGHWTLLVQPLADAGGEPEAEAEAVTLPPAETSAAATPTQAAEDTGYDALVARAVGLGREGRVLEAAALLDRAIASAPRRPEAWIERGGLRFLDGRYDEAISDLRRALAIRDDAYARDLLASSMQLAGRERDALAAWNALGRPELRRVEVSGLRVTRDEVARREIGLQPGEMVTAAALQTARQRLAETGAFDKITLRARPLGDGRADLAVTLSERHGFAHGPVDFLVSTGVGIAWQRLRLRYANLAGTGVNLGGAWRWQENRPETTLQASWPRPFGLPVYLDVEAVEGEQAYDMDGAFVLRRRGLELGARHVLSARTVVSLGLQLGERSVSRQRPDAVSRTSLGLHAGLDARLVETRRARLDGRLRLRGADPAFGSELAYVRGEAELRFEGIVSKPEGRSVERSVLAARVRAGWGSAGLPLDEMYALGASFESDIPLRAHALTRRGVIGENPVGRSFALLNVELRQRILHRALFDVGIVAFADAGGAWGPAAGSDSRILVDAGVGLRLSLLGGATLRIDQTWGLRDGRRRLFIGLGQAF